VLVVLAIAVCELATWRINAASRTQAALATA
jgi:hypothetical protein